MNRSSLPLFVVALLSAIIFFPALTIVDAFATCTLTFPATTIPAKHKPQYSIPLITHERQQSHCILDKRRKHWINLSLKYYTTVAREHKRRSRGQLPPSFPRSSPEEFRMQIRQSERHFFARNLIKCGKLDQAEVLYRRIIDEIQNDAGGCDHARLAVSSFLLALLKQRMKDIKGARSVFLNFFRTAVVDCPKDKKCVCSAMLLQAYALFEMKCGHGRKSLEIAKRAVELDEALRPVLAWKQFRKVNLMKGGAGQSL